MILEIENGFLVKVPKDIRKPKISNWSDGTTTLEFYSESYVMEYDSFEIGVPEEKQMKEITLPKKGNYKINTRLTKEAKNIIAANSRILIDGNESKWLVLTEIKGIPQTSSNSQNDFIKGFVAACAITLKNHGCDTIVKDTYMCNFYTVNQLQEMGVDDYDIELLKPIIKEIERKNRL